VPKWKTLNEKLKNARKRKSYHLEEDGENLQTEDEMPKRPKGQKAAKKAALAVKDKSKAMHDDGKSKESVTPQVFSSLIALHLHEHKQASFISCISLICLYFM
jgi:hypothetical protein